MYESPSLTQKEIRFLIEDLAQSCIQADLSWSFTAPKAGLTPSIPEERLTLYFDVTPGLIVRLQRCARLLGMAEPAIAAWRESLTGADALFFTLSCDLRSLRLYSQHLEQHEAAVEAGDLSPFEIYHGFKSLPDGSLRHDRYLCRPLAPPTHYLPPMEASLESFALPQNALAALIAKLEPQRMIWAEIEGGGRHSWLATLRELELEPSESADAFAPLAALSARLSRMLPERPLLHLAGGEDPLKGRFLTLYLEADGADIAEFLADIA